MSSLDGPFASKTETAPRRSARAKLCAIFPSLCWRRRRMSEIPAQIRPGRSAPLGATYDGLGVNFAVFSEHATLVELCLFDRSDPTREVRRFDLPDKVHHVWRGHIPELQPGTLYAYRVHGPYDPGRGLWFNPAKLLIDPYARAIAGKLDYAQP